MTEAVKENAPQRALLTMSGPRSRYIRSSREIGRFLHWVIVSAIELDDAIRTIAKAERRSGSGNVSRLRGQLTVGAGASRKISVFYRIMTEMALCRAVDNYLTYLTQLLSLVFRARPEVLRSKEEVSLDFVLGHATRAALINALVDRRVNQLAYQGMRKLAKYLSNGLGFELFEDQDALEHAVLLVEMRNLVVHNRGCINEVFRARVAPALLPRGRQLRFTIDDLRKHTDFLDQSVADLESRARDKFGIKLPYTLPKQLGSRSN